MARAFARTLIQNLPSSSRALPGACPSLLPSSSRILGLRRRASVAENVEIVEVDIGEFDGSGSNGREVDVVGMKKLEEMIHGIVVTRSAPGWLPFRPGSSYWVPPRKKPYTTGVMEVVEKLANPMTEEEVLSLTTVRGWPSSSYYIEGSVEFLEQS